MDNYYNTKGSFNAFLFLFLSSNLIRNGLRQPLSGRQQQLGSQRPPLRLRIKIISKIKIFVKTWKEKIKCVWSRWGSWSKTIKTCGEATLIRRRDCECRGEYGGSAESYEKQECDGKKIQARTKRLPSCYLAPEPKSYEKPVAAVETYEKPSSIKLVSILIKVKIKLFRTTTIRS